MCRPHSRQRHTTHTQYTGNTQAHTCTTHRGAHTQIHNTDTHTHTYRGAHTQQTRTHIPHTHTHRCTRSGGAALGLTTLKQPDEGARAPPGLMLALWHFTPCTQVSPCPSVLRRKTSRLSALIHDSATLESLRQVLLRTRNGRAIHVRVQQSDYAVVKPKAKVYAKSRRHHFQVPPQWPWAQTPPAQPAPPPRPELSSSLPARCSAQLPGQEGGSGCDRNEGCGLASNGGAKPSAHAGMHRKAGAGALPTA